ncbi:hypothetical protein OnM2_019069 [Erysiphe neolycopersici]|uniref:Uncharacterized protein n=1 Tax=Erysiphe neolycopersici TaxID=212602 RepID=A0A420I3N0_9PEZI|nr:hypothetical protein OnM2_019069 [Erysiphe neolycopersici]
MSSKPLSSVKKFWFRWKSLRLPWRKTFLVGLDLHGNTFWEFRDSFNSHQNKMRRIIKYKQSVHNSDVQISPQWHQWLRHTRADPPSLNELSQDILRQEKLKILAAAVDAKWASESSKLLDRPNCQQDQLSISSEVTDFHGNHFPSPDIATCNSRDSDSKLSSLSNKYEVDPGTSRFSKGSADSIIEKTTTSSCSSSAEEGPWKKLPTRDYPKDAWQPKSWNPNVINCNHKTENSHDESKKKPINDTK